MTQATQQVERSVRKVRRRLILGRAINGVVRIALVSLAVGLVWILAEPWVYPEAPAWARWAVVGGFAALGVIAGLVRLLRTAPTSETAALELDHRFGLKERVTTVLSLPGSEVNSPAGQAILADAQTSLASLPIASKFPVRPRAEAAFVPVMMAAVALAVIFYQPDTGMASSTNDANGAGDAANLNPTNPDGSLKPVAKFSRPRPPEMDRPKSKDLEELEEELDRVTEKWSRESADNPAKAREKVTELTQLEDKLKKFNDEKFEKLANLEKQLQQLNRLQDDKEFADGPMKELNEALAKGDLKKAQDEVDELKKKAKENKLDQQDLERLDKQMEKMKEELRRQAEDKEKEQKLKDMIDKAKSEGRDAESLERELEQLQQEMKQSSEAMSQMAERMQKMQQAIKKGDMEDLAEQLDQLAGDLKGMESELQDLEDASEYLQRLKDELKKACKACEECEGEMKRGERKDFAKGRGIGEGEREIDRNAKTSSDRDERIRGLFDPRGRKGFGGTTRGPAFTKRSAVELGEEIKQAVQEAPAAIDTQRLPRDAQESVREYFQKLGGTER